MSLGPEDPDEALDYDVEADVWPFPSERLLREWAPGLLQAQNAWMSSIDSLRAPDRKTHELIRMVCTVIARQPGGVQRHARLAAEVGRDLGRDRRFDPVDRTRLRDRPRHSGPARRPAGLQAGGGRLAQEGQTVTCASS